MFRAAVLARSLCAYVKCAHVVIPSCSGLRFSPYGAVLDAFGGSRNPFLFRAAVLARWKGKSVYVHVVIPSCSGLRFSRSTRRTTFAKPSRNPFLFRAAVLASTGRHRASGRRRNPFLFRAAVLAGASPHRCAAIRVVIPSCSGLRFSPSPRASTRRGECVVIPSCSGLRFSHEMYGSLEARDAS